MKRRAVLLSGGIGPRFNAPRYLKDLTAFYSLLTRHYRLEKDAIDVLYAGGGFADLDGDGVEEEMVPADRSHVEASFARLAHLEEGDQILVVVTDHGGPEGVSLWGQGEFYTPEDLERALRFCPATKILVLGQCFAGRFSQLRLGSVIVCAACGPDEPSFACPSEPGIEAAYDEFLYQFVAALAGGYPDGGPLVREVPSAPYVTMEDGFLYARDYDRWTLQGAPFREHPVLSDPCRLAGVVRFMNLAAD